MGAGRKALTPRVVLDTNVILSALIFSRGRFAWLREAWKNGRIRPFVCRAMAQADFLVTGGGDLQSLAEGSHPPIVTVEALRTRLGDLPSESR
jgi:predicted nucleic acid-binding protein